MKFPWLLSAMPASSVQDWLDQELEMRGIDAVVYTRYILSILQQDNLELEPAETDLFPVTCKKREAVSKGKGKNKPKPCRPKERDCEEMKKSAAVECLLSVSEQKCGIEELVDELCAKLKSIECEGTGIQKLADVRDEESSTRMSASPIYSPEEQAQKYYAAFPALSSDPEIVHKSFYNYKKPFLHSVWGEKKLIITPALEKFDFKMIGGKKRNTMSAKEQHGLRTSQSGHKISKGEPRLVKFSKSSFYVKSVREGPRPLFIVPNLKKVSLNCREPLGLDIKYCNTSQVAYEEADMSVMTDVKYPSPDWCRDETVESKDESKSSVKKFNTRVVCPVAETSCASMKSDCLNVSVSSGHIDHGIQSLVISRSPWNETCTFRKDTSLCNSSEALRMKFSPSVASIWCVDGPSSTKSHGSTEVRGSILTNLCLAPDYSEVAYAFGQDFGQKGLLLECVPPFTAGLRTECDTIDLPENSKSRTWGSHCCGLQRECNDDHWSTENVLHLDKTGLTTTRLPSGIWECDGEDKFIKGGVYGFLKSSTETKGLSFSNLWLITPFGDYHGNKIYSDDFPFPDPYDVTAALPREESSLVIWEMQEDSDFENPSADISEYLQALKFPKLEEVGSIWEPFSSSESSSIPEATPSNARDNSKFKWDRDIETNSDSDCISESKEERLGIVSNIAAAFHWGSGTLYSSMSDLWRHKEPEDEGATTSPGLLENMLNKSCRDAAMVLDRFGDVCGPDCQSDTPFIQRSSTLTFHKEESCFMEVVPHTKSLLTFPMMKNLEVCPVNDGDVLVYDVGASVCDGDDVENLLTSPKTHFRPIRQNSCDTDAGTSSSDDETSILVPVTETSLVLTETEDGRAYCVTCGVSCKCTSPNHYMLYKGQDATKRSEEQVCVFVPKFRLRSDLEKFCQTDDVSDACLFHSPTIPADKGEERTSCSLSSPPWNQLSSPVTLSTEAFSPRMPQSCGYDVKDRPDADMLDVLKGSVNLLPVTWSVDEKSTLWPSKKMLEDSVENVPLAATSWEVNIMEDDLVCADLKCLREEIKNEEEELFEKIKSVQELNLDAVWEADLLDEYPSWSSDRSNLKELSLEVVDDEDCPELEMINSGDQPCDSWDASLDSICSKDVEQEDTTLCSEFHPFNFDDPEDAFSSDQPFHVIPSNKLVYSSDLEDEWRKHSKPFHVQVPKKFSSKQKMPPQRRPCSFFMEGNCRRTDCKFSHDLAIITCRFWEEGSCFKGITCPFLHGYAKGASPPKVATKKSFHLESEADFPFLLKSDEPDDPDIPFLRVRQKKKFKLRHRSSSPVDDLIMKSSCKASSLH